MAPFPPLVLLLLGMAALLPRIAAVDILQAGGDLPVNSFLQAGMFYLVMQEDCNLVIYMGDQCCTNWSAGDQCCATWDATWATGTWDRGASGDGCFASMQQDRNFVVYGSINNVNTALWATNTYLDLANATGAYYVQLRSDGVLALMEIGSPQVIWSNVGRTPVQAPAPAPISAGPPAPPGTLTPDSQSVTNTTFMLQGNYVQNGSFLVNGDFKLILEQNCNLQSKNVVTGDVLWETASSSSLGACELFLQKNSTLEIRIGSSEESIIWKSNETNPGNADASLLALTENGTVEVRTKDLKVIWTMPSSPPPPMPSSPPPPMPSSPPPPMPSSPPPPMPSSPPPPMPSSPPPPMPSSPPPPDPPGGTAGPGLMIAGITGGVLVGSILLGVTLYCALRHYGYFDKAKKELQQRLQNKGGRARALTLHQVRKATNNNERLLGIGGFGPVYYGRLQDGQEVAVKALSATSKQGKQEFFNEIELLSVVHHKYLVSLVGYCIQWKQSILVYEYMSGGDLRDRLHGEESSAAPLSWNHRKNIILQVAEGIQYLHEGCKPAIIHRDIKTNNILLDKRMVAKVADFGLSKLLHIDRDDRDATHITTAVKGTTGYLDPEYYVTQKLTEKSDVYAYGVLLMEIITGRPLLDKTDHMYIVHKVRTAWKSKDLDGLADPNLEGNYDHEEFSGLVKLSLWCVKQSSSGRPSMSQVVHVLREIGMVQAGTSHPSIPVPEAVAGADYLGISMPYPSETGSSSANPKTDMSDPLISAFSTSSSSATRTGGKA